MSGSGGGGGYIIAVIGGGSSYTPELIEGVLERHAQLGVTCVRLMDIDAERLAIIGGLARRMAARAGDPVRIETTASLAEAVRDARFVLTQLRVGAIPARIRDERLGMRFGLIGQETTGVGGFAKALRTIPVMLDVAAAARELGRPEVMLLNFTNPAGLVTEALSRHARVPAIGLCNLPIGIQMALAEKAGCRARDVFLDLIGLNHLWWIRGVWIAGADRTADARRWLSAHYCEELGAEIGGALARFAAVTGLIPAEYLQYYYATAAKLRQQAAQPRTRGEDVQEIERRLFAQYADPALDRKPPELALRGGAYYSTVAIDLMDAILNDRGEVHVVNTPGHGAVRGVAPEAVVELPAVISARGAQPLAAGELPLPVRGLFTSIKAYEQLTVEAAVTGDRRLAIEALAAHPLAGGIDLADAVFDALLEEHRAFLPRFT